MSFIIQKEMQIRTSELINKPGREIIKQKRKYPILQMDINLSINKKLNQFKSNFFSETSVLLSSGMDLKKSLEIFMSGLVKETEKKYVENILKDIIEGSSLYVALERSTIFSKYDYFSVKIGEESGTLSSVLKELSTYYSKKISQQRQITGALTYPALVLLTTIFSLYFMLTFIVPMFEDVFIRFQGNIPPLTKTIINLSNSFTNYALFFVLVIAIFIAFSLWNRKKEWYRKLSSAALIHTPLIGRILLLVYKTRFCQTLKLLISSKVHLLEAVGLIEQMIGFYPFEVALNNIKEKLSKGVTLSEAMEVHPIFDKKMIAMTRVAEEVNKIDIVYEKLYQQYNDELDIKIKTMNNLLEPVLIIFVGGLVAVILVSMYLPIFQLGTGIK